MFLTFLLCVGPGVTSYIYQFPGPTALYTGYEEPGNVSAWLRSSRHYRLDRTRYARYDSPSRWRRDVWLNTHCWVIIVGAKTAVGWRFMAWNPKKMWSCMNFLLSTSHSFIPARREQKQLILHLLCCALLHYFMNSYVSYLVRQIFLVNRKKFSLYTVESFKLLLTMWTSLPFRLASSSVSSWF